MKFLIAGGGIGGLTAAVALAKDGHTIQLLEQASEPRPVGSGISLQPNARYSLGLLGLDGAVAKRGYQTSRACIRSSNGRILREYDFSSFQSRYGYLPLAIHRADLFDVLHQAATERGVKICFGQSVQSFSIADDRVTVTTEKKDEFHGDALIGADGIDSAVRTQLWGKRPTRYSGYVCWRGIVSDPSIVESVDSMNEIWGDGARFGYMRCSPDKVYWFATKTADQRLGSSHQPKQIFRGWSKIVESLVEATPNDRMLFNAICDRQPISPWSYGRVTLLGDAAHPTTPNFGQGGAQAIEDAIILSMSLSKNSDPERAFRSYESHRHQRTSQFVNGAWRFGKISQGGSWFAKFVRMCLPILATKSMVDKQLENQFDVQKHFDAFESDSVD